MKKIIIIALIILLFALIVYFFLPMVLNMIGIHPNYDDGNEYQFDEKKVLIITTSHDILEDGSKSTPTGVYASELFIPYYEFYDAGFEIDIASIKGGKIPIDPGSLKWPTVTRADMRYLKDDICSEKVNNSLSVEDVNFSKYDMIYIAGGWGAAYDLGYSDALGAGVSVAYNSGAIIGTVCHGSLGLINAVDENGEGLLIGKNVTGVTNKQVEELGILYTPMHPETELKKAGAIYKSNTAIRDILANLTVVDGRIVTGQNQNSSSEVSHKMMALLKDN